MPLTPIQNNGVWYVPGAADGAAPVPIGRRWFQPGPHVVGFDDSFAEPVVMSAFFDMQSDAYSMSLAYSKSFTYVGYMQFCRLSYRGNATIRPSVYGGRLADRDVYLNSDGWFVDMMGPSDANARNVRLPFYAYNGMLADGTIRTDADLYQHPRPNGSLRYLAGTIPSQSRYASIFAEISPGLLTPADVAPYVTGSNIERVIPTTQQQLGTTEAYRIALDALTSSGGPLAGWATSQMGARVVGPYVLLDLPDDENFGPTLCITVEGTSTSPAVVVRLLTYYDVEQMEADAGSAALRRMAATVAPMTDGTPTTDASAPRGQAGLLPTPALAPSDVAVVLDYYTVAVGVTPHDPKPLWPLSAFSWSVLLQYDQDTGVLDSTMIAAPQAAVPFDVVGAVHVYDTAMRSQPDAAIDTSNFTRAAMRRDNFAAGRKMRFVNAVGADV